MLTRKRLPLRLACRTWQRYVLMQLAMAPSYKKQVSIAVRQRDMQVAQAAAQQQSTLARFLPMLGPDVAVVPNGMQPYLASIGPTAKTRLKLQCHSGTADGASNGAGLHGRQATSTAQ